MDCRSRGALHGNCCATSPRAPADHLVVLGGGSAAFAAAIKASELGAEVTLINDGLPIGGTCVNVGCVPSKTLIRAAEAHHRAAHPRFAGMASSSEITDFAAVMEQKRQLVEELRQAKYLDVVADLPRFRRISGRGCLLDSRHVEVDGEVLAADRILVATGVAPSVPPIPGLAEAGYLTNESAFELDDLPKSLIVLGGRYVALELAQMFARFGARVTVLQRSSRILPSETPDLTEALTGFLADEGIEVVTGVAVGRVSRHGGEVEVEAEVGGTVRTFRATQILAATGRIPNTRDMGLKEAGVELDAHGFLRVDETLKTSIDGIYGAGDVIGDPMFVYTAAYEGALAADRPPDQPGPVRRGPNPQLMGLTSYVPGGAWRCSTPCPASQATKEWAPESHPLAPRSSPRLGPGLPAGTQFESDSGVAMALLRARRGSNETPLELTARSKK